MKRKGSFIVLHPRPIGTDSRSFLAPAPRLESLGYPVSKEPQRMEGHDPLELVGVAAPGHLEEMAEVLVEEYARLGWSGDQLMALFRDPFFQATHHIYRQKGEDYVGSLIQRVLARWTIGDTEGGPHARGS